MRCNHCGRSIDINFPLCALQILAVSAIIRPATTIFRLRIKPGRDRVALLQLEISLFTAIEGVGVWGWEAFSFRSVSGSPAFDHASLKSTEIQCLNRC